MKCIRVWYHQQSGALTSLRKSGTGCDLAQSCSPTLHPAANLTLQTNFRSATTSNPVEDRGVDFLPVGDGHKVRPTLDDQQLGVLVANRVDGPEVVAALEGILARQLVSFWDDARPCQGSRG